MGDNTYEVRIDNEKKQSGNLKDDWAYDEMMDDPEDVKPEGYDDIPETIVDADATKPDDWDDDEDGEWEAPLIPNPEYKGEWSPNQIKNPDYKGPWEHPMIDNPEWEDAGDVYLRGPMTTVGFEIWQVKAGTIFDNIMVTDDVAEAEAFFTETFDAEAEKKVHD